MSSTCCGGNCGCGSSCKCDSGCGGGGCKMYPESAAGSTTSTTTETTVLGVGPTQTGDVHGSEMAAAGTESTGGCKCNPCNCNPCSCERGASPPNPIWCGSPL